MSEELLRYFPGATPIGEGVATSASPFSSICETEYYDGPTAGLAFFKHGDAVGSFNKIWWDESQDNRLFEMHLIEFARLGEMSPLLLDLANRARNERWTSLPTAEDREAAAQLAGMASQLCYSRLLILARNIGGALFILPFTGSN